MNKLLFLTFVVLLISPVLSIKYAVVGNYVFGYEEKTMSEVNELFFDDTSILNKTIMITERSCFINLEAHGFILKNHVGTTVSWTDETNAEIGEGTYLFRKNAKTITYKELTSPTKPLKNTMCLAPGQGCSDGTLPNTCSATQPKYCEGNTLLDKCGPPKNCGCPSEMPTCNPDGSCDVEYFEAKSFGEIYYIHCFNLDEVKKDYPENQICSKSFACLTLGNCYVYVCETEHTCMSEGTKEDDNKCHPNGYNYDSVNNKFCPVGTSYDSSRNVCIY